MKYIIFFLNVFFSLALFCQGTSQQISHIRKYYTDVNAEIEQSKKAGYDGSLYCNIIKINSYDASWRAVGKYGENTEFWYADDPFFIKENLDEDPFSVLKKIVINYKASGMQRYEEYLFEDGYIVFIFIDDKTGAEPIEERYYFNKGKLIQYRENAIIVEDLAKFEFSEMRERLENLKTKFLTTF